MPLLCRLQLVFDNSGYKLCCLNSILQFPLQSTILSPSIIIQFRPPSLCHLQTHISPPSPSPNLGRTNYPFIPIPRQQLNPHPPIEYIVSQPRLSFLCIRLRLIPEMCPLRGIHTRQSHMNCPCFRQILSSCGNRT